MQDAARVVAIYDDGAMVGFCRVASDQVTFAFLLPSDAHSLYERFGFGPPDAERQMFRPGEGRR